VSIPSSHQCILLNHQGQHAHYNRILNSLVSKSGEASYTGARVSYQRRKEIDYFHPTPSGKVRVTRDAETLAIKKPDGIVQKQRIADLNIFCPNRLFDYRISINVENPGKSLRILRVRAASS